MNLGFFNIYKTSIFTINYIHIIIVHTFCERSFKLLISNGNSKPSDEILAILWIKIEIFFTFSEVLKNHFDLGDPVVAKVKGKVHWNMTMKQYACQSLCAIIWLFHCKRFANVYSYWQTKDRLGKKQLYFSNITVCLARSKKRKADSFLVLSHQL